MALRVLPLLALALALCMRRWRPQLPRVLLAIACFAAVLGPWYARNATIERASGDPDLLVVSLYHGSFPHMMYRDDPKTFGNPYFHDPDAAHITRDLSSVLRHIKTSFADEPLRYAHWYLLGKPGFFLSWGEVGGVGGVLIYPVERSPFLDQPLFITLRSLSFLVHWPLTLLALLAAVVALWRPHVIDLDRDRQRVAAILAVIFLYAIAIHLLGAPFPRYAIPFRPLTYVLGLTMARAVWLRLRAGRLPLEPASSPRPRPRD